MLVNFKRRDIIIIVRVENILTIHNYEKGEFSSSQSGGYGLDFEINKNLTQHPGEKYLTLLHIIEV